MLRKKRACSSGIDFCRDQNTEDLRELFEAFIKHERYDYATWVFRRFMNKKQVVKYAVFAAEQVIEIYEKKYPEDDRPRKAIEAAKAYLKKPCASTKKKAAAYADAADAAAAAADAAADAAYAAAYAADAAAYAYAAAYAAYAYADAADAAAADAADAAAAVAAAAAADDAAAYAAADRKEMKVKILRYGFELLYTGDK